MTLSPSKGKFSIPFIYFPHFISCISFIFPIKLLYMHDRLVAFSYSMLINKVLQQLMPDRIDLHLRQHIKKYLIIMNKRYSVVSLLNKLSSSYRFSQLVIYAFQQYQLVNKEKNQKSCQKTFQPMQKASLGETSLPALV